MPVDEQKDKAEKEEKVSKKPTETVNSDLPSKEDLQTLFSSGDYSSIENEGIRSALKSIDDEAEDLVKSNIENSEIVKGAKDKTYYKLIDTNKLQRNLKHNSTYWNPAKGSWTGKGMRLSSAVQILSDAQNRGYRFVPLEDGSYTIIRDGERVDPNNINFQGLPTNDIGLLDMFTPQHNQRKNISKAISMAIQGGLFDEDPEYLKAKKAKESSDSVNGRLFDLGTNKQNILDAYLSGYNPTVKTVTVPGSGEDNILPTILDEDKEKDKEKEIKPNKEDVAKISKMLDLEIQDALPLISAIFTIGATRGIDKHEGSRKTFGLLAAAGLTDIAGYLFDDDVHGAELMANLYGTGSTFITSFFEKPSATRRRSAREVANRLMRSTKSKKKLSKLAKAALNLLKHKYIAASPTIIGMVASIADDIKEGRPVQGNEITALISVLLKARYSYARNKSKTGLVPYSKKPSANPSGSKRSGPIVTSSPKSKSSPSLLNGRSFNPKGVWNQEGYSQFLHDGGKLSLKAFKNGGKLVPKGQNDLGIPYREKKKTIEEFFNYPNVDYFNKENNGVENVRDDFTPLYPHSQSIKPNLIIPVNRIPGKDAPAYQAKDPLTAESAVIAFEKDIDRGNDILSKTISKKPLDIAPGVQIYEVTVPGNVLNPALGANPTKAYYDKKTNSILSVDEINSYLEDKYGIDFTSKTGGNKTATSFFNSFMGPQGPLGLVGWGDIAQTIGVFANKPVEEEVAKVIAPPNRPLWMPRATGASYTEKQEAYNSINNQSHTIVQGSDTIANTVASILGAAAKAKGLAATSAHFEGISREARALNDKYEAQNYQTSYENLKGQRDYQNAIINETNRVNLANAKLNADFKRDKIKAITDIFGTASQNAQLKDQALKDSILKAKNWEMQIKQQELASLINVPYENRSPDDINRIKILREELKNFDPISLVQNTQFDINSLRWRDIFKRREMQFKNKKSREDDEYAGRHI